MRERRQLIYEMAKSHVIYKCSCGTFMLASVLSLTFHRRELLLNHGERIIPLSCLCVVQSALSYFGDVVYLGQGAFYPDIACAVLVVTWACVIFRAEPLFALAIAVSGSAWCAAFYLNHVKGDARWIWWHAVWHLLPLEILLGTTTPSEHAYDRALLSGCIWAAIAAHHGAKNFSQLNWAHDAHAYAVCALVSLAALGVGPSSWYRLALAFSAGYFFVELITSVLIRDPVYTTHGVLALALVACCMHDQGDLLESGAKVLLVEASTPLFHYWQRDESNLGAHFVFVASFAAVRCVFLPLQTLKIWRLVVDWHTLILLPLNLFQFVGFASICKGLWSRYFLLEGGAQTNKNSLDDDAATQRANRGDDGARHRLKANSSRESKNRVLTSDKDA